MRKFSFILMTFMLGLMTISCSRVAPNYQGVLMENFGQNGKSDFTLVKGRVWTASPGVELFQVPLYDQRGNFSGQVKLKASNNTEFSANPKYSYRVIEDRSVDIAFAGSRLNGNGEDMLNAIEDDILEPRIDDLIKEFSRAYHTDSLMATGGQLIFEKALEIAVAKEFEEVGFELRTFQSQLEFSDKVKGKIDTRNEVDTNLSVLDSQIFEQQKKNELENLKTEQALIKSRGLTSQILQDKFIDKWDGKTPIYGSAPFFIKPLNKNE